MKKVTFQVNANGKKSSGNEHFSEPNDSIIYKVK